MEFTREDMVDAIADAISDSMDIDWTSRCGAEAIVRHCGVWELYEALSASAGYMRNAKIDLETGAPKATAIRTIDGGLARVETALAKVSA